MSSSDDLNKVMNNDSSDTTLPRGPRDESELRVGQTLKNRFVLESVLGEGGMGTIFKARDLLKEEMDDRKPFVAIKVLHPKYRSNDSLIRALQREARKSQELAHPNIVNVHDFDRDGLFVYMVMEYLEGQTLNAMISGGSLDGMNLQQRWNLVEMIARGLAYAHQKKVIHHDIKPANIFVSNDNNVKVLDFGIAKAMRASPDDNHTVFDQFSPDALTPAYATCEMLRWETPDVRDDIFALGCVAYEILTGKHPFNKVPALQAAERKLKPKNIKGLSKEKWNALKASLQFKRADRLAAVTSFLDAGNPRVKKAPGSSWIRGGVLPILVVILVVGGVVIWDRTQESPAKRPVASPRKVQPSLLPQEQAKVDRLMRLAELHASVGRIVEPLGSSALDAYDSVLKIDPSFPAAVQGLNKSLESCRSQAKQLVQQGDLQPADEMVKHCLMVKPGQPALRQLDRKIRRLMGS